LARAFHCDAVHVVKSIFADRIAAARQFVTSLVSSRRYSETG
jgi:hypothetical protein